MRDVLEWGTSPVLCGLWEPLALRAAGSGLGKSLLGGPPKSRISFGGNSNPSPERWTWEGGKRQLPAPLQVWTWKGLGTLPHPRTFALGVIDANGALTAA